MKYVSPLIKFADVQTDNALLNASTEKYNDGNNGWTNSDDANDFGF